ncbi:Protein-lysine deacetylase [Nocardioides aquaticus]|uniref:Phosphocarrier protein HPr n=1 Tax=Nocardioides aquaticus TaxID=160826 RepID=A0ABX8EN94_9ACTN|nr:Protein-lysine deacetylase [Nocardioides aquaticus]
MIGLVVVSHSRALADAVVELATQMTPHGGPTVAVAAGVDGGLGTDATAVAEALADASSPDGVLVLMDLGSAVMSAELAIELADLDGVEVRLSPAPLVEGLVAAVVRAAGGADLATVAREAESALEPKRSALGEPAAAGPSDEHGSTGPPDTSVTLTLVNPGGLHARPAAQLAAALGRLDAEVAVAANGREADGASSLELLTLGTGQGTAITVSATGPDAQRAVDTARTLVEEGFGELPDGDT